MNILFPILGYLLGSLPFSIWVTRYVKNVDVRDAGSGHATTTNTIRQAGFGWGALVLILDIAKGFIPTYLAVSQNAPTYIVALTAAFAVLGHCYPVFAQCRGGNGCATGHSRADQHRLWYQPGRRDGPLVHVKQLQFQCGRRQYRQRLWCRMHGFHDQPPLMPHRRA